MGQNLLRLWLFVTVLHLPNICSKPVVDMPLGTILGYYKVSKNGRRYAAYEGIPYAQPPTNNLRFEDSVAVTTPFGQLNATEKSGVCAQYFGLPNGKDDKTSNARFLGTEDCLYLNIYVPELEDTTKLMPVIFFIHGGSYQFGSVKFFDNTYLADRDVIFITINYRLGPLGFLSTEDEVVPGNMGLKDQNLALRWTHQHIKNFRGDPNRIVLSGFSAGSSSIQYHYLSSQSCGLFSSSIGMSGTAFNPWAFTYGARQKAKQLGALFQCPTENTCNMINCLKKVPVSDLVQATEKFQGWQYNPEAPWAPVVDKHSLQPFISLTPKEILDSKLLCDVPAIFGAVNGEGGEPIAEYASNDRLLEELNDDWVSIAPSLLEYNYTLPIAMHDQIARDSRKEYFGTKSIDRSTVLQLQQLVTDQRYFIGFENGIRLQAAASKSPVYMYYYSYRGSLSLCDFLNRGRYNYAGACHADDMLMVVESTRLNQTKTAEDWKMTNFLMDMWTSIAYNGVPRLNVSWQPVNASEQQLKYLHISGPENYSMSGSVDFGKKSFWKKYFYTV